MVSANLFRATLYKIPALRSDDLLIDRLLQAIETGLHHANLHLIFLLLPGHSQGSGSTREPLAAGHRNGWRCRIDRGGSRRSRRGARLPKGECSERERSSHRDGTGQMSHDDQGS